MIHTPPIQTDRSLSTLCTFGIGGPARYFIEVTTIKEMQEALIYAHNKGISYIILGKGSNCLFDDRGYDGLVILNKIGFLEEKAPGVFYVGAGYSFSRLGAFTARKGWSGLEFASGIPGSVGGAVYMNAGANSRETRETLSTVQFVTANGEIKIFERAEMTWAYRSSLFQHMSGAIVSATFALTASEEARKKQIDFVRYRQTTQPYSDMSAGCIFRNPPEQSAGALIDQSGLKGLKIGGAAVSDRHANFIINAGGAKSQDVIALMQLVQQRILAATGVSLISEVVFVPYQGAQQGSLHG
ncbi:MAG: UDP-N-acetylmuramate dehydrogenase [Nitrosomonas sp.]|nr:MAG: UDP-N-acetylmuramate dehydrogenase [Nitrosomonas sp.]